MNRCFFTVIAVLIIAAVLPYAHAQSNIETLVNLKNSYPDERRYNEVCWLTAHNAFANQEDGWWYPQQAYGFSKQFEYGVYSFMIDLHWYTPPGATEPYIALCHEDSYLKKTVAPFLSKQNCFFSRMALGGTIPKPATYFFDQVHHWLENNPDVIITVHLESDLQSNSSDALQKIFKASKVEDFIYKPSKRDVWPTLGNLRQSNKRLIIFSDNLADDCIYVQAYRETEYNLGLYPGCEMRTDKRSKSAPLFLMNHFYKFSYDMPSVGTNYDEINSLGSILARVNECYETQKRLPNFIAVDFVQEGANGGARKAALMLNELPIENFNHFVKPIAHIDNKLHAHDEL